MLSTPQAVRAGEDIIIFRYYSIAVATLFFYDYFLVLSDEVKYVWKGRKTWLFYVFLINRYAPFVSQTWDIVAICMISANVFWGRSLCWESSIIKGLSFGISTLTAQVVIGTRAYALNGLNRKLLALLLTLGLLNFSLTVALVHNIIVIVTPPPLDNPTEALGLCLKNPGTYLGFLCIASILAFDAVAIISIVFRVVKLARETLTLRRILKTIFRDVTIYFLVIFISHLCLIVSIKFARFELKVFPVLGLEVMIPMMTSRFTLALRKVADKGQDWEALTIKTFAARAPTIHDTNDDASPRPTDPEAV